MSAAMKRVIKVGGSLFDWPQLSERLWAWLARQTPGENYLIAGGGAWVDAVRAADQRFQLGDAFCHELSIELMATTGKLLKQVLLIAQEKFHDTHHVHWEVLDVQTLSIATLPQSWDVTSDSIAAQWAERLDATELVLLKSTPLESDLSAIEAAERGVVDRYFPTAAACLPNIRFIHLRDAYFAEWALRTSRRPPPSPMAPG